MRRNVLIAVLTFLLVLTMGTAVACGKTSDEPTPPESGKSTLTLTVNGDVATTGIVGREVKLPSAKANDETDGDLTKSVKVNVDRLKADGSTDKQILFRGNASVEQKFTPTGNDLLDYKITYFISNSAGELKEAKFDFKATKDDKAPKLSLDTSGDFAGFDVAVGITGKSATDTIVLPGAKGLEEEDNYDVSDRIQTRVYFKDDADFASPVYSFGGGQSVSLRLTAGEYKVRLTLSDAAGNESTPIEYPLSIAEANLSKNLVLDKGNVVLGFDSRYNDTLQQIEIGRTSYGDKADDCASAAIGVKKLFDEYVAITLNIDPFVAGGDLLYDIGFLGSKNGNLGFPDGSEGTWAPYMVLRIAQGGGFELRPTTAGSGSEATQIQTFTGSVRDGKDHTLYIKHSFVLDNENKDNSYIRTQVFVDMLPVQETTGLSTLNYAEFKTARSTATAPGTLEGGLFDKLATRSTGEGWISFGAATFDKNTDGEYADDIMRIKGVAVYSADTTEFNVDIVRPQLISDDAIAERVFVNEEMTLPTFSNDEGLSVDYAVYKFDKATHTIGDKLTVNGQKITFAETGYYYAVISATDAVGNKGYVAAKIQCIEHDHEAPVIEVDETELKVQVGQAFDIPVAKVTDNVDGDISANVTVGLDGAHYAKKLMGTQTSVFAEGEHWLVYTAVDMAGNTTEKRVKVTVSGNGFDANKNLLEEHKDYADGNLMVVQGALYEYTDKYVYDQKVSVRMSVDYAEGATAPLFQINLRGSYADGNKDWPTGIVMRFGVTADISLIMHDSLIVASTSNIFNTSYWRGTDVLFQYQTKQVKIGEEEYLTIRAWINGQEIQYSISEKPGVTLKLVSEKDGVWTDTTESGTGSLAVNMTAFAEGSTVPRINLSAGPVRMVSYNGFIANLKEIYVGKEYTEYPADPLPPEGILAPEKVTSAPEVKTDEQTVKAGGNITATVADGPQGEYKVALKMQKVGTEFSFVLTGANKSDNGWFTDGGGLALHYRNEYAGFYLGTNGGRFDANGANDLFFNTGVLQDNTDYYMAFRIKYVYTDDAKSYVNAIDVQMWFGTSAESMALVAKTRNGAEVSGADGYLNATTMTTAQIATNGILILPSPAGGAGALMKVTGIVENAGPVPSIAAPEKVTEAPQINTTEQVVNKGENISATVAKSAQGEYKVALKMQKVGSELTFVLTGANQSANGWFVDGGGIALHYRNDYNGFYMGMNGGRFDADATKNFFFNTGVLQDNTDYYMAFQIKYIYADAEQTKVSAVDVQMWFGTSADSVKPVAKTLNGNEVTGKKGYLNAADLTTAQITTNGILILPSPAGGDGAMMKVTGLTELAEPVKGIAAPEKVTAAPQINTTEQVVNKGENISATVAKSAQGESKVVVKMQKVGSELTFVLTGANQSANGWFVDGGGIALHYRNDYNGFYMGMNGGRFDADATKNFFFNTGVLQDNTDYYMAFQIKYIYADAEQTKVSAVDVQMWFGTTQENMQLVTKTLNGIEVSGADGYLNTEGLTTAQITTNGILILPSPAGGEGAMMKVTGISATL